MSLRQRLIVASSLAVGLAVLLACVIAYVVVRGELRGQVDDQLDGQANAIEQTGGARFGQPRPPRAGLPQLRPQEGGLAYLQLLNSDGSVAPNPRFPDAIPLPVSDLDELIALRQSGRALATVDQAGAKLRVLTIGLRGLGAVQLARPLDSIDRVLSRIRWFLAMVCLGGVGVSVVLGRAVTRRVTAPLREVAQAAEHIAETDDLSGRIEVQGSDDVGLLAGRFNLMLDRLQASREELSASVQTQRQIVADASHELRTPITSLRTNIEVLLDGDELDPVSRVQLLADVRAQSEELGDLVADVIELARGDTTPRGHEDVRLDSVAAEAVDRARRNHPGTTFVLSTEVSVVEGDPVRLSRAIGNLLENAAKHGGPDSTVDVRVGLQGVIVRDRGPGLPEADLPHLFDRFYRGETARGRPGTGLGLAIVRQVAESHGGTVRAENASDGGGGARFVVELPARPVGELMVQAEVESESERG